MTTLLDARSSQSRFARLGMAGAALAILLLLAGCEAPPSAPPGARQGMGGAPGAPGGLPGKSAKTIESALPGAKKASEFPNASASKAAQAPGGNQPNKPLPNGMEPASKAIPSPSTPNNPLAPATKVEQAGNPVELASLLLILETNPFLDRLPKPQIEVTTNEQGETVTETSVPADPFENVSLLGIVYHPKNPLALLMVSGGVNQSQMVRKGDILMMDGGEMKVLKIQPDAIELQLMGKGGETRTLSLPDMVGYSASSSPAPASSGLSNAGAPPSKSKMMPVKPSSGNTSKPTLGNIQKISGQQPNRPGSATGSMQPDSNMNLMEPEGETR